MVAPKLMSLVLKVFLGVISFILLILTFALCFWDISVCASMLIVSAVLNGSGETPIAWRSSLLISVFIAAMIWLRRFINWLCRFFSSFVEILAFSVDEISIRLSLISIWAFASLFSSFAFMLIPDSLYFVYSRFEMPASASILHFGDMKSNPFPLAFKEALTMNRESPGMKLCMLRSFMSIPAKYPSFLGIYPAFSSMLPSP